MPIYEYKCNECGKDFELFRSITDKSVPSCKFCKGPVSKLISRSSFHLKGSGWYVTDYARKNSSGGESDKNSESTSEASKTKTDTTSTSTSSDSTKEKSSD
jgi:putative FmdB family regulatory protein